MKICTKCGIEKQDSAFGIDKRCNKLNSYCKKCINEYGKNYYREIIKPVKHPDKPKREVRDGHKWCLKCGLEKPLTDFYNHGGLTCKVCANKRQLEWQKRNRPHVTKVQKLYRKKIGRERLNKLQKEWRANNRELCNLWARNTRGRLGNSYIKQSILKPKGLPLTKENIEIARANILLKKIKKQVEKLGFKICDICKLKKDISEFPNCSYIWKGVKKIRKKNLCKECDSERTKKYRKK